jgi:hypothetical protein
MHVALIRAYNKALTKTYRLRPAVGINWGSQAPDVVAGTWDEVGAVGKGVYLHGYREEPINGLTGLRMFLETAATKPDVALIQGRLRAGAEFQVDSGWKDVLGRQQENYEDYPRKLLVLDADEIEGDIGDAPDTVRDALYEIPELDGCAHVACFSPSAGIKPKIRVRIFIVTTEEHTLASQRAFVRYANQRAGRKLFDDSIYGPQSFVALAGPILFADCGDEQVALGRPVPTPIAWHFDGDEADIGVTRAAAVAGLDARDIAYIEQYAGTVPGQRTDWMAQIAPGNVALPLHRALCSAAFAAPDNQQAQHFGAFVALARRTLLEMDPNEYPRREREHLSVFRLQQAWDKARARARAVTNAYSTSACVPPTQSAKPPRQELADRVKLAAEEILKGKPKQILATSPPGAGKSYALRSVLTAGVLSSDSVLTAAPTHALAEQLAEDHRDHAFGLAPAGMHYGVNLPEAVRHHKGRKLLCTNTKYGAIAERAEQLGISAKKSACALCPDRGDCKWLAQDNDTGAGEVLLPHAALFNEHHHLSSWASITLIDESVVGSALAGNPQENIELKDLNYQGGFIKLRDSRAELISMFNAAMPRGQSERALVPSTLTAERIDAMLALEETHRETLSKNLVNATQAKFLRDLAHVKTSNFVTGLLSNMRDSHRLSHYKAIRVHHARGIKWVTAKRRLFLPDNVLARGAVHLDGTAKLDPGLAIWRAVISPDGTPFDYETIDVAPTPGNVVITQVIDAGYAKSALLPKPDKDLDEAIERASAVSRASWIAAAFDDPNEAARIQDSAKQVATALTHKRVNRKKRADSRVFAIWLHVLKQAFTHKQTLLVAQKDVLEALSNMGLPGNVLTAHFGALRGLNNFKDVPSATIVGRPALDNHQLELYTEALFIQNDSVAPIAHAEGWGKQTLPVHMVDGTTINVQCDGHPDANARALQALISHAEVAQAVARIRPYDRTSANPCDVTVFGQWPVGLPVTRLCTLADVRPEEGDVALIALGLFEDAGTTLDAFAGLYKEASTGWDHMQRVGMDYVRALLRAWLEIDPLDDATLISHHSTAKPSLALISKREVEYLRTDKDGLAGFTLGYAQNQSLEVVELHVVRKNRCKRMLAVIRRGLSDEDIRRRSGLTISKIERLMVQQIRRHAMVLVRGLIEATCNQSPALREYARGLDDVGCLEFIQTWVGWRLN